MHLESGVRAKSPTQFEQCCPHAAPSTSLGIADAMTETETEQTCRERSNGDVFMSIMRFLLGDEGGADAMEAPEAEVDADFNSSGA